MKLLIRFKWDSKGINENISAFNLTIRLKLRSNTRRILSGENETELKLSSLFRDRKRYLKFPRPSKALMSSLLIEFDFNVRNTRLWHALKIPPVTEVNSFFSM